MVSFWTHGIKYLLPSMKDDKSFKTLHYEQKDSGLTEVLA